MTTPPAFTDVLGPLRDRIDALDSVMVECLAQRVSAVEAVIALKRQHGIPARLPDRIETVVAQIRDKAAANNCPPDLAEHLWRALIEWTISFEERQLPAAANAGSEQDESDG